MAKANLDKPLIVRDPNTLLISVNFDPKLVALLREVKYLEQQNCPDRLIPESTAGVFQQNETYRKYLQNLDVTVVLYNQVRETIMDVEYALIEEQLKDIDQQLEKAISGLTWTSEGEQHTVFFHFEIFMYDKQHPFFEGVWEYIESTRDLVRDLERRVRLAKANVDNISMLMASWCKSPLYRRKGEKKESLLNLEVQ